MATTAQTSTLAIHQGKVLMMVADKYPSLILTLVEGVQNAIDARASKVFIGIDLTKRSVVVADNGHGVTREQFDEALLNIAETRKKSKESLGRFGIGMIAPLNKCVKFTFTSCSAQTNFPVQWTFEQSKIERRSRGLTIPNRNLSTMPGLPGTFAAHVADYAQGWRTIVHMDGITKDRIISSVSLDELEENIRTKLGHAMHQRGITCRVVTWDGVHAEQRDIVPRAYTGEPLAVFVHRDADAGKVEFKLFRAKRIGDKRQGKVSVSETSPVYPIAWRDILIQATGMRMASESEAFKVLNSGYFEGLITAEGLRLAPERTKFLRNDALIGFFSAIDMWYQKVGRNLYEIEQEATRDQRYRQLSLNVMGSVRDMLRRPEFASLLAGVQSNIGIGKIGAGHGTNKDVVGKDTQGTTRTGQGGAGNARKPNPTGSTRTSGPRNPSTPTRDGDLPTGVVGKQGSRRTLVRDDSLGLWVEVTDFEFSTAVWDFNRNNGVLSFNSGSALWSELDGAGLKRRTKKNDAMLEQLQKWVVLQVLSLLTIPEDQYEEAKSFVNTQLKPYVAMFIQNT